MEVPRRNDSSAVEAEQHVLVVSEVPGE